MPLIVLSGPPGAGKTTVARAQNATAWLAAVRAATSYLPRYEVILEGCIGVSELSVLMEEHRGADGARLSCIEQGSALSSTERGEELLLPTSTEIPAFDVCVARFRAFLAVHGAPGSIVWAFREDFYGTEVGAALRARWPLPGENSRLIERVFDEARTRGAVDLHALFSIGAHVVATVDTRPSGGLQGEHAGLKLSIRVPFSEACPVDSRLAWHVHRLSRDYRRFQRCNPFVPSRRDVRSLPWA